MNENDKNKPTIKALAKNRVVCFGELLIRLSPKLDQQWLQLAQMPVYLGGAELNVATALAKWKVPVSYCTVLPDHYLTHEIIKELKGRGLDTSAIQFAGERIGIYFLPQNADLQHAGVIYDRANSSFANIDTDAIDWERMMQGASRLHLSAISPAVSGNAASASLDAVDAANRLGISVSIDLNYRSKLWKYGKSPIEVMPSILQHCDLVMGNIWSAKELLGIPIDTSLTNNSAKGELLEQARKTSLELIRRFPSCQFVANTFRFDAGGGVRYYATIDSREKQVCSVELSTDKVIGKIGSGDCFMAGLLYGIDNRHELQHIVDFAAAAAFGKLQELSDATDQDIETVKKIMQAYGRAGLPH